MKLVNVAWYNTLQALLAKEASASPRGQLTKEILANTTVIPMCSPVLTIPERKLGYKFMAAEAAWILSGDNRVSSIKEFSPHIEKFSDDGQFFFGAYGPKVRDQLSYVVAKLIEDPDSRQAVINIWREQPRATKDVPCTLSLQFFIRSGRLHCVDTMRSSDIWLGWPYDVFNMSMISLAVLILLRRAGPGRSLVLGDLHLVAGSQHLYDRNFEAAQAIPVISAFQDATSDATPMMDSFETVDDLIERLWAVAYSTQGFALSWLAGGLHAP